MLLPLSSRYTETSSAPAQTKAAPSLSRNTSTGSTARSRHLTSQEIRRFGLSKSRLPPIHPSITIRWNLKLELVELELVENKTDCCAFRSGEYVVENWWKPLKEWTKTGDVVPYKNLNDFLHYADLV